jgi:hypothetical protein
MKQLLTNNKGIYEYLLTKVVMLMFVMGLVSIFSVMLNDVQVGSAYEIAQSESVRLAKEIDDAIGFKGVSNTITVHAKRNLQVGQNYVPYRLNITENGVLVVEFMDYPYVRVSGVSQFGINLQRKSGTPQIDCTTSQIGDGVSFIVEKESRYEYVPAEDKLYLIVTVTIDASDDCHDQMIFEQRFVES